MNQGKKVKAAVCYEVGKPLVMEDCYWNTPAKVKL